jgi:PEP-CTERM motif
MSRFHLVSLVLFAFAASCFLAPKAEAADRRAHDHIGNFNFGLRVNGVDSTYSDVTTVQLGGNTALVDLLAGTIQFEQLLRGSIVSDTGHHVAEFELDPLGQVFSYNPLGEFEFSGNLALTRNGFDLTAENVIFQGQLDGIDGVHFPTGGLLYNPPLLAMFSSDPEVNAAALLPGTTIAFNFVPEPSSLALSLIGLVVAVRLRRVR